MDTSVDNAPSLPPREAARPANWREEAAATLTLAWPLIIAQLAQIALFTTDVIMMGWLGPSFLAAGMLTVAWFHPFLLFGIGIISVVASLVAQAKGAGDETEVRRFVRQGFWVALGSASLMAPIIWHMDVIFAALGQSPELSQLSATYAKPGIFVFWPALGFIVLRALLATHNDTRIVLYVTLVGVLINMLCNYALMFGHWGFPRLELTGAAISTVIVNLAMFLLLLGYTLINPVYQRYSLYTRLWRPDWEKFRRILHLGTPIGLMMMAEVALFSTAGFFMGWLGTDELAAHAVALQLAAIAFMVPLGLSQASTVRVGLAYGARDRAGIHMAGWVSIIMGTAFMSLTAMIFFLIPETLISLFLDPGKPENHTAFKLAVSYLSVAAMFQLVDGAQVVAAAVLRGINDTAIPMLIAFAGYWGVGLWLAYVLGFATELRGIGIWLGLAASLAFVAVTLMIRFMLRDRFGLAPDLRQAEAQ